MPSKLGYVSSRYTGVFSKSGGLTWCVELKIGKSFPEQARQLYGLKTYHLGVYGQLVPVQTETVTAAGSGSGRRTRGGQAAPAAAGTAGGGEEQRQARGTKRDHEQ